MVSQSRSARCEDGARSLSRCYPNTKWQHFADALPQDLRGQTVLDVDIEFHHLSVYQLHQLKEKFDLVLFLGVLYHLRHPLLALDILHEHAVKDILVIQSMLRGSESIAEVKDDYEFWEKDIFLDRKFPQMYFVEQRFSADPTNWWIPNRACMEAMLRSAGFEIVAHPEAEVFVCRTTELNGVIKPADELKEIQSD